MRTISYLQVSERFYVLSKQVQRGLLDLLPFFCFYLTWILVLTLLYTILGVDIQGSDSSDYKEVPRFAADAIQVFRNSIGDMQTPSYEFWDIGYGNELIWAKVIAISMSWLLFLFNEAFLLIVLLSLLVAILYQSTES